MQGSILPVLPERSRLRRHACSKKKTQATPEASDASGDERLEPEATSFFSSIHLYRIPFLSGIIIRQNRNDREDRDSCQLMRAKKKRRREKEKAKKKNMFSVLCLFGCSSSTSSFAPRATRCPRFPCGRSSPAAAGSKARCTAAPGGGYYIFLIL